jgi:hypothetical protein
MREVKADSRPVVLSLLAESIGQAREPAHPHPQRSLLAQSRHWAGRSRTTVALEIRSLVAVAGTDAAWWDDEFALIPSKESQH